MEKKPVTFNNISVISWRSVLFVEDNNESQEYIEKTFESQKLNDIYGSFLSDNALFLEKEGACVSNMYSSPLPFFSTRSKSGNSELVNTIKIHYIRLTFAKNERLYHAKLSVHTSWLCCASTCVVFTKVTSYSFGYSSNKLLTVSGNHRKLQNLHYDNHCSNLS